MYGTERSSGLPLSTAAWISYMPMSCGMGIPNFQTAYNAAAASGGQTDPAYQAYLQGTRTCMTSVPLSYAAWVAANEKAQAAAVAREQAIQDQYDRIMDECQAAGGFRMGRGPELTPCTEEEARRRAEFTYMTQGREAMMAVPAGTPSLVTKATILMDDPPGPVQVLDPTLMDAEMNVSDGTPETKSNMPLILGALALAALAFSMGKKRR